MSLFRIATFASAALAVSLALAAEPPKPAAPPAPPASQPDPDALLPKDNDYIVHEWGTFTSFAGSDGVALDFRTAVADDLPAFVVDRVKQSFLCERREVAYQRGLTGKATVLSRQRMETPVTYFYANKERIVDVVVEFPKGLLTEFYPPVRQFGPAYKKDQPDPLEGSWLRWGKIRVIPAAQALGKAGVDPLIPAVKPGEGDHYAYARQTDSAHLQLTDPGMVATYREKFLFYRGVGNFDQSAAVKASGPGRFLFSHTAKTPIGFAFLVQADSGGQIRFARFDNLGASTEFTLPTQPASLSALGDEMTRALVGQGLYEKEARAMVKTWQASWFGEPGTRVLYALPQAETDRLLPLKLQPAPKEMLRVMVGRLEILTPEQEGRIAALAVRLGSGDPDVREQTAAEIRKLGRFAEPALTRVAKSTDDPQTRDAAKALLRDVITARGPVPAAPEVKPVAP